MKPERSSFGTMTLLDYHAIIFGEFLAWNRQHDPETPPTEVKNSGGTAKT
jgi:hypothetical protein